MGRPCLLDSPNSWIPLPQASPLPSQGLQMGWLPCPGLLCLSSWPLLGLDPSRRGPWTGVSSPKTGPMLDVRPMSCATASTETYGSEASSSALLASLGATSWSILVSLAPDFWLLSLPLQSHHILCFSCLSHFLSLGNMWKDRKHLETQTHLEGSLVNLISYSLHPSFT